VSQDLLHVPLIERQPETVSLSWPLVRIGPLLYAAVVTLLLFAGFYHWGYDDPYITYRYARNLLSGLGFVYNPAEPVLSTTTPLFTLLLALLGRAWPDLPRLALALGAAGVAAGALSLWSLAHTWQTPVLGWAALLLYPTFPHLLWTLGSETPLYLAFGLGAFAYFARRRYAWAGALAALAALARADGLLVAAVLILAFAVDGFRAGRLADWRAWPWRGLAAFLLVLLPWVAFALLYFGSPVPATLSAKQQQAAVAGSQLFAPGLVQLAVGYAPHEYMWVEAALALLGVAWIAARAQPWRWILLWGLLYFAAYSVLGVTSYFWYYVPLLPAWVAAVGGGAQALAGGLARARPAFGRPRAALAGGLLIALLAAAQARDVNRLRRYIDARLPVYRAAGEWLARETPPASMVGTLEVGVIGYYSRRPMVDFAGLLQPAVAAQLPVAGNYQESARWALAAYQPEYVVLDPTWFPDLMAQSVLPRCAAAAAFAGRDLPSASLNTYPGEIVIYHCAW
jgi:hypothetical protein